MSKNNRNVRNSSDIACHIGALCLHKMQLYGMLWAERLYMSKDSCKAAKSILERLCEWRELNCYEHTPGGNMKKIIDLITEEAAKAFKECGYEEKYGMISVSNRPDLCEYQCNGAMAAAKAYKKAPIMIANEVVEKLKEHKMFEMVEAVMPGFINIKLHIEFLREYMNEMMVSENYGCEKAEQAKTIMIDYGGPNVAKPLHVGHLRSAIIGESIKRMGRFMGHKVIGDVHLGDWGLQMGLIITEL